MNVPVLGTSHMRFVFSSTNFIFSVTHFLIAFHFSESRRVNIQHMRLR